MVELIQSKLDFVTQYSSIEFLLLAHEKHKTRND